MEPNWISFEREIIRLKAVIVAVSCLVVVVVSWRGVVMAELGLVTGHVKPELFPPSVTSRCYN